MTEIEFGIFEDTVCNKCEHNQKELECCIKSLLSENGYCNCVRHDKDKDQCYMFIEKREPLKEEVLNLRTEEVKEIYEAIKDSWHFDVFARI